MKIFEFTELHIDEILEALHARSAYDGTKRIQNQGKKYEARWEENEKACDEMLRWFSDYKKQHGGTYVPGIHTAFAAIALNDTERAAYKYVTVDDRGAEHNLFCTDGAFPWQILRKQITAAANPEKAFAHIRMAAAGSVADDGKYEFATADLAAAGEGNSNGESDGTAESVSDAAGCVTPAEPATEPAADFERTVAPPFRRQTEKPAAEPVTEPAAEPERGDCGEIIRQEIVRKDDGMPAFRITLEKVKFYAGMQNDVHFQAHVCRYGACPEGWMRINTCEFTWIESGNQLADDCFDRLVKESVEHLKPIRHRIPAAELADAAHEAQAERAAAADAGEPAAQAVESAASESDTESDIASDISTDTTAVKPNDDAAAVPVSESDISSDISSDTVDLADPIAAALNRAGFRYTMTDDGMYEIGHVWTDEKTVMLYDEGMKAVRGIVEKPGDIYTWKDGTRPTPRGTYPIVFDTDVRMFYRGLVAAANDAFQNVYYKALNQATGGNNKYARYRFGSYGNTVRADDAVPMAVTVALAIAQAVATCCTVNSNGMSGVGYDDGVEKVCDTGFIDTRVFIHKCTRNGEKTEIAVTRDMVLRELLWTDHCSSAWASNIVTDPNIRRAVIESIHGCRCPHTYYAASMCVMLPCPLCGTNDGAAVALRCGRPLMEKAVGDGHHTSDGMDIVCGRCRAKYPAKAIAPADDDSMAALTAAQYRRWKAVKNAGLFPEC